MHLACLGPTINPSVSGWDGMSKSLSKSNTAPVIACYSGTAARLGAVPVRDATEAKRLGYACIPIRGHDGRLWVWPIEQRFLEAIERRLPRTA
jgi:hypothetical protein